MHFKGPSLLPLATSENLRQLVHLDLFSLKDAVEALPSLASGPLAGRLQNLGLGQARLHGRGFAALLRAAALLEGLTTLSLNHNALDDAEVEALASHRLARLRSLELSENELTDAGLKALARSPLAGRLRWLGFSLAGEFTEAGHRALAEALHPDCQVTAWFSMTDPEVRRMNAIYGGRWAEE
jgi:hypothetical protein